MRKTFFFFIIFLIFSDAKACFGPELFVGYEKNNSESYLIANLLDVYIKEKTGINVLLKEIDKASTGKLIDKEAVDIIAFTFESEKTKKIYLGNDRKVSVYYRKKIEEDLRFATLIEALTNLSRRFTQKDLEELKLLVDKKGKIKRTIKEFLIEKGIW